MISHRWTTSFSYLKLQAFKNTLQSITKLNGTIFFYEKDRTTIEKINCRYKSQLSIKNLNFSQILCFIRNWKHLRNLEDPYNNWFNFHWLFSWMCRYGLFRMERLLSVMRQRPTNENQRIQVTRESKNVQLQQTTSFQRNVRCSNCWMRRVSWERKIDQVYHEHFLVTHHVKILKKQLKHSTIRTAFALPIHGVLGPHAQLLVVMVTKWEPEDL